MLDRIADGRTDLVFDYLAAGHAADSVDDRGVSLIKWCAYYGDVSAIRFLLTRGASLDRPGRQSRPQRRGVPRALAALLSS